MKTQGRILLGMVTIVITAAITYGCSQNLNSSDPQMMVPEPIPSLFPSGGFPQLMEVVGSAAFGNQCPYGSYVAPLPVPLELWECPLHLPKVELLESLPSLILQADCKKKTLDVRSQDRSIAPVTWEVMPDGNFYVVFNAGVAQLKDDGEGHSNCSVPMVAYMWGRIECKDRDQASIRVETVWRLGVTMEDTMGQPSPNPSASVAAGSPGPHPSLSPVPTPGSSSNPGPSVPHTRPRPPRLDVIHPALPLTPQDTRGSGSSSGCKVPASCYFHSTTRLDQCQ